MSETNGKCWINFPPHPVPCGALGPLWGDSESSRHACTEPKGHEGPHRNPYLEWTGFDESGIGIDGPKGPVGYYADHLGFTAVNRAALELTVQSEYEWILRRAQTLCGAIYQASDILRTWEHVEELSRHLEWLVDHREVGE
jgi:hypothetical protein